MDNVRTLYVDGVLRERWDDGRRIYTEWDQDGVQILMRPYTDAENAAADATIAEAQAEADAAALAAQTEALVTSSLELSRANAPADGTPWVQPTGASDAYPLGSEVTHDGKRWVSAVAFNVWEPGVANWREHVISGCPTWVQPTGASDDYNTGDCVSFEGACYQSLIDANVWSPTVYPAGWEEIVCP
jgi:hypothetical protein